MSEDCGAVFIILTSMHSGDSRRRGFFLVRNEHALPEFRTQLTFVSLCRAAILAQKDYPNHKKPRDFRAFFHLQKPSGDHRQASKICIRRMGVGCLLM